MGKELDAIGNWGNRIGLGFRCERLEGLGDLSFWSDSRSLKELNWTRRNFSSVQNREELGF